MWHTPMSVKELQELGRHGGCVGVLPEVEEAVVRKKEPSLHIVHGEEAPETRDEGRDLRGVRGPARVKAVGVRPA